MMTRCDRIRAYVRKGLVNSTQEERFAVAVHVKHCVYCAEWLADCDPDDGSMTDEQQKTMLENDIKTLEGK